MGQGSAPIRSDDSSDMRSVISGWNKLRVYLYKLFHQLPVDRAAVTSIGGEFFQIGVRVFRRVDQLLPGRIRLECLYVGFTYRLFPITQAHDLAKVPEVISCLDAALT